MTSCITLFAKTVFSANENQVSAYSGMLQQILEAIFRDI